MDAKPIWYPSPFFLAQAGHFLLAAVAVLAPIALTCDTRSGVYGTLVVLAYAVPKEFIFDLLVERDTVRDGFIDLSFYLIGLVATWLTVLVGRGVVHA